MWLLHDSYAQTCECAHTQWKLPCLHSSFTPASRPLLVALRAEKLLDFDEWCAFIRLTQLVDAQFSQQVAAKIS